MKTNTKSSMGWSLHLGRWLGIDVYIHVTFLLLLAFIGLSHGLAAGSATAAAGGVLFAALRERGEHAGVADVMRCEFAVLAAADPLETAPAPEKVEKGLAMPVLADGRLIGLMTAENVGKFFMIRAALADRLPWATPLWNARDCSSLGPGVMQGAATGNRQVPPGAERRLIAVSFSSTAG